MRAGEEISAHDLTKRPAVHITTRANRASFKTVALARIQAGESIRVGGTSAIECKGRIGRSLKIDEAKEVRIKRRSLRWLTLRAFERDISGDRDGERHSQTRSCGNISQKATALAGGWIGRIGRRIGCRAWTRVVIIEGHELCVGNSADESECDTGGG